MSQLMLAEKFQALLAKGMTFEEAKDEIDRKYLKTPFIPP